jgi:hypothetical protein
VEYKDFCHEVENAFGKEHLEKNPLLDTELHKLKQLVESNKMLQDEVDAANNGLAKLAQRVSFVSHCDGPPKIQHTFIMFLV